MSSPKKGGFAKLAAKKGNLPAAGKGGMVKGGIKKNPAVKKGGGPKQGGGGGGGGGGPKKGGPKQQGGSSKGGSPGGSPVKGAPRARPKKISGGGSGPQKRALPTSTQNIPRGSEQEIFSLWDIEGDGCIDVTVIGDVLRAIGQSPTEEEVEKLLKEFTTESGTVDWPTFQKIMGKGAGRDKDLEQDVLQAYYVWDQKDNGVCLSAEIENAFMSIGEKLTDHEVEDMVQYADPNHTGFFKFEDFVKTQINK